MRVSARLPRIAFAPIPSATMWCSPCCASPTCGCAREPKSFLPTRSREFNDDTKQSLMAVGFGLLNLAYVGAALWALIRDQARRPSGIRWAGFFVSFVLLRSAFLGTLENPEPRYTLECYPVVIMLAASLLARRSWDH